MRLSSTNGYSERLAPQTFGEGVSDVGMAFYQTRKDSEIMKTKIQRYSEQFQLVKNWFEERGCKVLPMKDPSANGPDLVAIKNSDAFRVEIKKLTYNERSWKIKPVSQCRKDDDFIAVVFPDGYIFVERMKDHIKCCTSTGSRCFSVI